MSALRLSSRPLALSTAVLAAIALAMLLHGPIVQLADYHHFADRRSGLGLPNVADVLSNLVFLLVGAAGLAFVWRWRRHPGLRAGREGWLLFFGGLVLTAFGSSYYHLAPDDARLVWDRLPIALTCAGLLAAVACETAGCGRRTVAALALLAVASVGWWHWSAPQGGGDLRPYLLLQIATLVWVPALQRAAAAPRHEQRAVWLAVGAYVLAKLCELADHALFAQLGLCSGHTLKHLLAGMAAAAALAMLRHRVAPARQARRAVRRALHGA